MITLDKVKLVTSLYYIDIINKDIYDTKSKSGIVTSISFTKTEPYSLYVELDYEENELVIEFTGKILHDRYSELINSNNVEVCLKNIETECGCRLDIPSILQDNKVVKIDVSKDIEYPDCKGLTAYLSSHVKNYKKYLPRIIGGNFVIEKNVKTRGYKKRMTVYDKYKEMQKASNKSFLYSTNQPDNMLESFNGKVRLELNLNSIEQIRKSLKITSTSLMDILSAPVNPICDFISEVFENDSISDYRPTTMSDLCRLALLKECNMDIEKVEMKAREVSSKGTHISQLMKPFRTIMAKMSQCDGGRIIDTLQTLLLFEIFIILLPCL